VTEVTDLVLADAKSLSRKLSNEDRATMDEFMTMIRDVEVRMARLEKLLTRTKYYPAGNTFAFRPT